MTEQSDLIQVPKLEDLVDLIHLEDWNTLQLWINWEFKENICRYLTIWLVHNSYYLEAITLVEYFGDQIKFAEQISHNGLNILHCLIAKKRIRENLLLFKIILENEYLNVNQERIENNQPQKGETPLMASIKNFDETRLHDQDISYERILLEHGANPNLRFPLGFGPLEIACSIASIPLVQILLSYGADPTNSIITKSTEGESWSCINWLFFSISIKKDQERNLILPNPDIPVVLRELINAGAIEKNYPIINAAKHGRLVTTETIKILLEAGYPIDQLDQKNKSSALMYAAQTSGSLSNFETVKFLVENGAQINQINPETKRTCFHYALHESKRSHHQTTFETVEYLVNHGADQTLRDSDGCTPLANYLLSDNDLSVEILYFLLKKSPPEVFSLKTNDGKTIQDLIKSRFAKDEKFYTGFFETLIGQQINQQADQQTDQRTNQQTDQQTNQQTDQQTDPTVSINRFDQQQCAFCLDDLHLNTCATQCGHRFHVICLSDYLEKTNSPICPLCRANC